jgi:hypothetical protein
MIRIAMLLLATLGVACAEIPAVAERVKSFKIGQRVDVELVKGGVVTGHLSEAADDGFELRETGPKRYTYGEVKEVRKKLERSEKWVVGLVVYGILALISGIVGG